MSDPTPRLRVQSTGDVAQLLPYLVGFTPEESLVLMVTRHGQVVVTARADLADLHPAGNAEQLLDRLWDQFPDATGYLAAYSTNHTAAWDLISRCASHRPAASTLGTLLIDDNTWHTPDGHTGPVDPYGPLAAEATYHGLQRRPARADLAAGLTPATDTTQLTNQVAALRAELAPLDGPGRVTQIHTLIDTNLPIPSIPTVRVSGSDAIRLALLADHPDARDTALLMITTSNAAQHQQLWRDVTTQIPAGIAENPLYLAGMAAWISGDGASANIAMNAAYAAARPGHDSPADLIGHLIDTVTPPTAWTSLRAQALAHADPHLHHTITRAPLWETVSPPPNSRRPEPPPSSPPASSIGI